MHVCVSLQEEEHGGTDGYRVPRPPPAAAAAEDMDADVEMTQRASSQGTVPAAVPLQHHHHQQAQQQQQQQEEQRANEGSPAPTASGGTFQAPGGTAFLGGTGPATLDLGLGYMQGVQGTGGSAQKGATSKPSVGRQEGSFPGSLYPGPLTVPLVLPSHGGVGDWVTADGDVGGGKGGSGRLSLPLQNLPGGAAGSQTPSPHHGLDEAEAAGETAAGGDGGRGDHGEDEEAVAAAAAAGVIAGSHVDSGEEGDGNGDLEEGGKEVSTEAEHEGGGGAAADGVEEEDEEAGGGGSGEEGEEEDEEMEEEEEEEEAGDGVHRKPTEQEDVMPQVVNETEVRGHRTI